MLHEYEAYLKKLPLSAHTKRNYVGRVKSYLAWLENTPDGLKALSDSIERDFFLQDYKCFLLKRGSAASSLNAALAALDSLYVFLGLGAGKIKRADLPAVSPRALDETQLRRFLKAVAHASLRNQVVVLTLLHCGLRVSELSALNVSDVLLMPRKKELTVRCGKGCKRRTIPINSNLGEILQSYLAERGLCDSEAPLLLSQEKHRLSNQSIDRIVRQLGMQAGLEISCHTLRHTCLTLMVRRGVDVVIVAEVAGHADLMTTKRYTLASEEAKQQAMEVLNYGTA